ncbi:hypothetical protein EYZ11_002000 [Aspergillus tanneri]|uniref:NTF2 domain-containing protein n=1 Tax=Aspergillus tanneri TaxID=1220188 RepID=A0A4S3JRW9_9EURO|nr:uncharacterized protein ATNIH1004_004372 [Aspergillus tanneri]KAA8648487.1 hypothetical protein ATNIH1004_004372 [Aspergillus tanneri]THC98492.1 hypothetical protein EYZ11_002000 [Aspergillus tanneri]
MIFKDLYQRFLVGPKPAALAPDVSVNYITTTTTVDGADAVFNHFTKQEHVVKCKSQQVIDAVEGPNSVCVDVETTLEFVSGGGVYLPSMDDNFLADRVATFPTVHIVHFNSENQIQRIRIYWDQASLLKQVEVIGSRGRGWPIRDAKEQTRLIKSAASSNPAPAHRVSQDSKEQEHGGEQPSKNASPGKKHIKDPYAAESLFELLSPEKDRGEPIRAPRAPASAKPPPREYSELFVGGDEEENSADGPEATPSKSKIIAPKLGAGKNFRESRIFDDDETVASEEGSQQIAYRAHPKRFDHFELGADNSQREIQTKPTRPGSRHVPQWNFEDFATPEKPKRQLRGEEIRHFGWSDDEPEPTPPVRPRVAQPRRDIETHFLMTDKDEEQSRPRYISAYQNKGMSLYKSHLFDDENEKPADNDNAPLAVVHNGVNRKKDFESHWEATDESPADSKTNVNNKPVASDRQKAVKMMESSWEAYDESPQPSKFVRPPPQRRAIRAVNQRSWDMGNE